MRTTLFSLLFALTSVCVSAQSDFVVTLKGDTLRGELKVLSYDLIDRVQRTFEKKKTMFTALQLRGISVDGQFFVPVKFDNSIRLMKVLKSGYLSLYAFRLPNQTTYDGRLLTKIGSKPQEVPNIGFKRIMAAMLEDCPDVSNAIKEDQLNRADVEAIVDRYNGCVTKANEKHYDTPPSVTNPTLDFISKFKDKVIASTLTSRNDVSDVLNNIQEKVKKNEPVPAYLTDGLKSYLDQQPEFKEDLEQLLALLKK